MNKYESMYCDYADTKNFDRIIDQLESIEEMIDFINYLTDVIGCSQEPGLTLVNELKKLVK